MALFRQLLKRAIASYFGGTEQTAAEGLGIYYQGGPLAAQGLITAFPYQAKGIPDSFYFTTQGTAAGCVMTIQLPLDRITRQALGGPVSGWRDVETPVICHLWMQSHYPHMEQAETFMDDLIEAFTELIYADRTLGTTNAGLYPNPPYPNNRLIEEAGEKPFGIRRVMEEPEFVETEGAGNITAIHSMISFAATTYQQA